MVKSFRDMKVWRMANELSYQVFELTKELPRSEDYGLTSQIRRSANSISANISEAFGRKTKKDKQNFYIVARGSAFETQNHLLYGGKVKYFNEQIVNKLIEEYDDLIHQLNKIMKALG